MSAPTMEESQAPEPTRVRHAIVVVDVVESVRLMQAYEVDVIDRWRRFVAEVRSQVLPRHGGRLVKSLGDGMLLVFDTVRPAAAAAFDMQQRVRAYNAARSADALMLLRMGANVAEVVVDELDIYGPGVNVAARVAALAGPEEIVATLPFCDELVAGLDAEFDDLGECYVKHLDAPLRCYRLLPPQSASEDFRVNSVSAAAPAATERAAPAPNNVLVSRLAVMPLTPLGLPPTEAAAGHLIADNITARLSRGDALRVISRLSTTALSGRPLTVPELAQRLSAQYLVAGSIAPRGERLWRITLELADGADGAVLWTHTCDVEPGSLLQDDDDYSAQMAARLMDAVTSHQIARLQNHSLPSLQSYSLQLAGLRLMHKAAVGDFDRARAVLETLVDRHPRAPIPRAWLSQWWVLRTTRGLTALAHEEAAQALSHTRAALQTDPDCALAWATQGFVQCHLQHDLDAAQASLGRALAANPNEPLAWLYQSVVHGFRGQGDEAFRCAETATSLSPLDPQRHYFDALTASAAITAGHLVRGIELARRALQVNRNHLPTLRALTVALAESGEIESAREAGQRVLALAPEFNIHGYVLGAPKGSEATRQRFAAAFSRAGLPMH